MIYIMKDCPVGVLDSLTKNGIPYNRMPDNTVCCDWEKDVFIGLKFPFFNPDFFYRPVDDHGEYVLYRTFYDGKMSAITFYDLRNTLDPVGYTQLGGSWAPVLSNGEQLYYINPENKKITVQWAYTERDPQSSVVTLQKLSGFNKKSPPERKITQ